MGIGAVPLELTKDYLFEVSVALTPNLHHPATLRLSREKIEIEITGESTNDREEHLKYRYSVVRCSAFSQRFFLFGLVQTSSRWGVLEHAPNPRAFFRATYQVSQLISTESDYLSPDQLNGFKLHSPDLVRWIGNTKCQEEIAQLYVKGLLFSTEPPGEFVVRLKSGAILACGYEISAFHSSPEQRVGVEFPPSLTLIHRDPVGFEVLANYLRRTLALFEFLLGFPMTVVKVEMNQAARLVPTFGWAYYPTSKSADRSRDFPIFFPLGRNLRFALQDIPEFPFELLKAFYSLSDYRQNLVQRFLKVRKTAVSEDRFLETFRLVETMAAKKSRYFSEEINDFIAKMVEKLLVERGERKRRIGGYLHRLKKINEEKLSAESNIREVLKKVERFFPEYLRKDWSYPVSMDRSGLVNWATPKCFCSNLIGLS